MLEKIKNIGEKIPEPIVTLIIFVLLITVDKSKIFNYI